MSADAPETVAVLPPVRPVVVTECWRCNGSGWYVRDTRDGSTTPATRCAFCAGRGRVATEGGEP